MDNSVGRNLRVLIVSGIFPPDIGGPATHAYEVARVLRDRGQEVLVLSLSDRWLPVFENEVVRISRRWPWPARAIALALWILVRRGSFDVIYATGLQTEAVAGGRFARVPTVVKIVGDPAWERGRRWGLVSRDFDAFQAEGEVDWRVRALCAVRDWTVSRADAVVVPSVYLRRVVREWMTGHGEVDVITNGVNLTRIPCQRIDTAIRPLRAMYVGRLVSHKQVEILIEAVAMTPGVELEIAGDGPEREELERRARRSGGAERIRFLGSVPHDEVLQRLSGSHVLVSSASYEGLPHTAVEALACGAVPVTSAAGGTAEAVEDGSTGIIVDPPAPEGFSEVLAQLRDDPTRLGMLSDAAVRASESWSVESRIDRLLVLLGRIVHHEARTSHQRGS